MSINIGSEMMGAIVELRGNRDFEVLLDALANFVQKVEDNALAAPVEQRVDHTAYARGMLDIWEGFRAAYLGVNPTKVKPNQKPRTRLDMSE